MVSRRIKTDNKRCPSFVIGLFFPPLFFPLSSVLLLRFYAYKNSHLDFGGDFPPIAFRDHIGDLFVNLHIVRANLTHFYSTCGYTHKTEDSLLKFFLTVTHRGCGNLYYSQDVFFNIKVVGIVQRVCLKSGQNPPLLMVLEWAGQSPQRV